MTSRFPKMIVVGSVAAALAVGGAGVAQASPHHNRTNDRPTTSHERHSGDRNHSGDRSRDRHHSGDRSRDNDRDNDGNRS
jgi:hypothetical protein